MAPIPRRLRRLAPGLVLLAACSRGGEPVAPGLESASARGSNLLLVTLDTTRADHLACFGASAAATPNLDALAARGIRFSQALATAPLTAPSHASILTGLYPPAHGVRNNGEAPLASEHVTLAEVLRERGYLTAGFVSAFVLDRRYGLDQGFEVYDDRVGGSRAAATFGEHTERPGQATTDAAVAWLASRDTDRPFFAWVHYYDAHDPYLPPPPFDAQFRGREYAGEIAFVDAQVGRLVAALEAGGAAQRTVIAVVADHGESLGQHGESTHGRTIYDEVMRVPWILAVPGAERSAGTVVDDVVSTVDVMPTLLDVLGVAPPPAHPALDGASLLTLPRSEERAVYLESMMPLLNNGWAPLVGLRSARAKFIRAPRPEYFRIDQDPFELSDAASPDSDEARELARRLEALSAEWPKPRDLLARGRPQSQEARQALQALGYASAPSPDGSIGALDPKDMLPTWALIEDAIRLRASAVGPDAQRKLAEALSKVERALALSPRDRAAFEQKARIFTAMGRLDDAAKALREYVAILPSSDAYVFLAQLALARGKPEEVEPLARAALELEPAHGGAYIALGDLLLQRGDFDAAILQFEAALRVDAARAQGSAGARLEAARKAREQAEH